MACLGLVRLLIKRVWTSFYRMEPKPSFETFVALYLSITNTCFFKFILWLAYLYFHININIKIKGEKIIISSSELKCHHVPNVVWFALGFQLDQSMLESHWNLSISKPSLTQLEFAQLKVGPKCSVIGLSLVGLSLRSALPMVQPLFQTFGLISFLLVVHSIR